MQTSEQINEISAALSKAQGSIEGALKDSKNPFFKSDYADLASVIRARRQAFAENGLCLVQSLSTDQEKVYITTMLCHSSGQWFKDTVGVIPLDWKPQTIGTLTTYLRRYSDAAFSGIAQIDDDGNAASGRETIGNTGVPKGINPRAGMDKVDTKVANNFASRIADASNADREDLMFEVWCEAKENHAMGTAVWAALPMSVKDRLKELKEKSGATQ
jgi:hypothetical protein